MIIFVILVPHNDDINSKNCDLSSFYKNKTKFSRKPESDKIPSAEELEDQGSDEFLNGKPILDYFKNLAKKTSRFSFVYANDTELQVWNAYAYKNHYFAVLASLEKPGTKVYCRYIDKNGKEIGNPVKSIVYPLFAVYCSRRNNAVSLAITLDKKESITPQNSKKLMKRKFKEYQHNVSFCLSPVYGKEPKWLNAVEMIEHYKLQGINHFFIYIREITEYDLQLFKSYEKSGEVEIIHVSPTNGDVIVQQLMGVADCLLRSRTHSKWSIFADIDERLIMTDENDTIDQFMRNLKDKNIASITFPQRWILKREEIPAKFINEAQIVNEMPTRAWHETTSPAMKGHPLCQKKQPNCWGKNIVQSEKVIFMLVHEVEKFYPGYRDLFLDSADGYIRHYRDVKMQSWETKNMNYLRQFGPFYNTSYPENLGEKLSKNVLSRLHKVYN